MTLDDGHCVFLPVNYTHLVMGSIDYLRPAIHSSFTTYVHVNKTACKDLSKAYLQCRMDKVSKAGHAPSTSTLTYYHPRTRV